MSRSRNGGDGAKGGSPFEVRALTTGHLQKGLTVGHIQNGLTVGHIGGALGGGGNTGGNQQGGQLPAGTGQQTTGTSNQKK